MRPVKRSSPVLFAVLLLAACGGGGGGDGMPMSTAAATPSRGTLLQSPPELLSTLTASSLLLELNVAANQQLLGLSGPPVCDILMYHIEYATVGGANEPTTASAALMVPTGFGANCTGARPIVLYAHGTTTDRAFNMTNMQNAETLFLAALFASQGYIVVAPNYAGYDTSTLDYHPYLIADQQSKDMIDALTAARSALFSSTPPSPAFADITPPQTPANLAEVFALGFGTGNLLQNGYRLSYLQDAQANPDGGFPTITTGVAATTPGLPWRQALQMNDLRNWVPSVPVLLCGGDVDPLVFWLNTALMQDYWTSRAPPSAPTGVLDLESAVVPNDPYGNLKLGFEAAKALVAANAVAQGATDGGAFAVAEAYHAMLVAPFCFTAVRSFFANQ